MSTETYLHFDDIAGQADIPKDGIASRVLFSDEHTRVVLFGFDAGQELCEHTASVPALVHFLRGDATLTLGADTHEALAGFWAYLPAQLPHSILARTPLVLVLTLLKSAKPAAP